MMPYLEEEFGNPSSGHSFATGPKRAVMEARREMARLLNARPDEIVFTSGGTESNNLAIMGVARATRQRGRHIITSAVEHPAVTEVCRSLESDGYKISVVGVDSTGRVDPEEVYRAIEPGTILITIMLANNETGTLQPVRDIARMARTKGIMVHTDAAQAVGKIPVDVEELGVDLLTVAGHKLYAPKGVGALYIRRGTEISNIMFGAGHEAGRRPGTENVASLAGLGKAASIAQEYLSGDGIAGMAALRDRLYVGIRAVVPDVRLNGHPELRLPNTLSVGFPGVEASKMLELMPGLAASAGAACHTGQEGVSGVLAAMLVPAEFALGTIRFSLGRATTMEEIDRAVEIIARGWEVLQHQQSPQPAEGFRLTSLTLSPGCACKIRPQLLESVLRGLPPVTDPAVLVGNETSDDAAVYRIADNMAIVQTVDFIPPVVDDPYRYGAISAANALSDIYAMGGRPLFALSVVAFPEGRLPDSVLRQILAGAHDKAAEAGISIVGGHSVDDKEPKFGLVVTGMIDPSGILRNSTAKPGDLLVLTKPAGTGIVIHAARHGFAGEEELGQAISLMSALNRTAAEVMAGFRVNACTDVTGFGLLGHLKEMVRGAGVSAILWPDKIPTAGGAFEYVSAGHIPGGGKNNQAYAADVVTWSPGTSPLLKVILSDAQTSGGLLISLPASEAPLMVEEMHRRGVAEACVIGEIVEGLPAIIV